jgi:hypothetical protein
MNNFKFVSTIGNVFKKALDGIRLLKSSIQDKNAEQQLQNNNNMVSKLS